MVWPSRALISTSWDYMKRQRTQRQTKSTEELCHAVQEASVNVPGELVALVWKQYVSTIFFILLSELTLALSQIG